MKNILIIGAVIIGIFISVFALAFGGYGYTTRGGPLSKGTGSDSGTGGCSLSDKYFTDTTLSDNPDGTIATLEAKYPAVKDVESNVRDVLAKGKQLGINPVMALATWNGESSYRSDLLKSAFGYGNTDSGIVDGTQAWQAQLDGVYLALGKAKDSTSPYSDPVNTNSFTRFYYNYTTAMQEAYKQAGNKWIEGTKVTIAGRDYSPVEDRMVIIKLLEPGQIACDTSASGIASGTPCPNVTSMPLTNTSLIGSQGIPKAIILHYLGAGLTVPDGAYKYFNSGSDGRSVYVQFVVSHSGQVYQLAPENLSVNGAANYNNPTKDYGPGAISISIENEGAFESADKSLQETPEQIKANINLTTCLMKKYNIAKTNTSILSTNSQAREAFNIISHKEADARGGDDGGVRGSRRTDPGDHFMNEILGGLN